MDDTFLPFLSIAQQGYCCSQILVKLILDAQGVENTGLLRALYGLCKGMSSHQSTCGLLTGGACALAYVTGRGNEWEMAHPMGEVMRLEYLSWFTDLTRCYGGINCSHILGNSGEFETGPCKTLLAQCWEKILELFDTYGVDPSTPAKS